MAYKSKYTGEQIDQTLDKVTAHDTDINLLKRDSSSLSTGLTSTNNTVSNLASRISTLENSKGKTYRVVQGGVLPDTGEEGIIYLLKAEESGDNLYTEWMFIDGKWEMIGGGGDVDLDGYYDKEAIDGLFDQEVGNTDELETTDKTSLVAAVNELCREINYVEPTISQLTLSASHSGNVELTSADGVTFTLTGFTHKESTPSNFEGDLTFKRSNGTVIKSEIAPSSTSNTEVASDTYTATSAGSLAYVLSGVSKKGKTVSKTVTAVTFYRASYIGGNPSESVSDTLIGGLTKVASNGLSGTRTVTLNEDGYVWFITTNTISKITSGGFDVPFALAETYTYNGGSYKCYKTQSLISAGT